VGYGLLIPMGVLASGIPYAVPRNHWMFSSLMTPLEVLVLDFATSGSFDVVLQRLANTAIGCTIVLTAGYLFRPRRGGFRSAVRSGTAQLA
jgi:hypothetical protein